jgi:hypothetical protein
MGTAGDAAESGQDFRRDPRDLFRLGDAMDREALGERRLRLRG